MSSVVQLSYAASTAIGSAALDPDPSRLLAAVAAIAAERGCTAADVWLAQLEALWSELNPLLDISETLKAEGQQVNWRALRQVGPVVWERLTRVLWRAKASLAEQGQSEQLKRIH